MVDILDEVKDDLKQERVNNLFFKHGVKFVIAAVVVLLITLVASLYDQHKYSSIIETGSDYFKATKIQEKDDRIKALSEIVEDGSNGFATISALDIARLQVKDGKYDEALESLNKVIVNSSYDRAFRELAELQSAYILIKKNADEAEIISRIDSLLKDSVWRFSAQELKGFYLLEKGKKPEAVEVFKDLLTKEKLPSNIKARTDKILSIISAE
jgi:hypothetical protein